MSEMTLMLRPRDPVLVRDGRPFTADPGAQARSMDWPMPSTLAGAIRTHLGNLNGFDWRNGGPSKAREIQVVGPLMVARRSDAAWKTYLTAPADAVVFKPEGAETAALMRLQPFKLPEGAGCDLPDDDLQPLAVTEDLKPERGYDYWSLDDAANWLSGESSMPVDHLAKLPTESRVHVKINPATGTHAEGGLFATTSICFPDCRGGERYSVPEIAMTCRLSGKVSVDGAAPSVIPFGGERRVTAIEESPIEWPTCPESLKQAAKGKLLKLQLVTPAIFSGGWKPGWIGSTFPGTSAKAKLVSAAVGRRTALSGWDYETRKPKAARYAAPAGSVYFFELVDAEVTADLVEKLWFASVCDDPQDNLDGFGLVIPGIWDYSN